MQSTENSSNSTQVSGGLAAEDREHYRFFEARDLALGGLFGALAITLPIAFHALGPGVGPIFLPMYQPVLALGLLASWEVSLIVGCTAPLISSALSGMPPLAPPVALLMACELGALAVTASLARAARLGIWPAAVTAIIASRVAGTLALLTIGRALGYDKSVMAYAVLGLALAWPGIALQLSVVPAAVAAIDRASLVGPRWRRANP